MASCRRDSARRDRARRRDNPGRSSWRLALPRNAGKRDAAPVDVGRIEIVFGRKRRNEPVVGGHILEDAGEKSRLTGGRANLTGANARYGEKAAEPFAIQKGTRSIPVTISIGLAGMRGRDDSAADMLKRADLALYRAKEIGTPVGLYVKGDDGSHRHRLSILGELRRAVESNQLELHYQPKVSSATGELAGCEALVRWRHPEHGYVPPSEFVPHAERTGAIRPLTTWVVATALKDVARWER